MTGSKTILLVDDDEDDRMFLFEALNEVIGEVKIVEMSNGSHLITYLETLDTDNFPELILLDMNLPGMSGLEILTLLKQDVKLSQIPVVMISTTSNTGLIARAYEAGLNAFIIKPVTSSDYSMLARTIYTCFLRGELLEPLSNIVKPQKSTSIVIIEDNDDHWHLLNFSFKHILPNTTLIRLRDRASTLDFFANNYKTLNPPPEMILVDLYLPSREFGLDVLDNIRYFTKINRLPQVPVIMLSNSDHKEDIRAGYGGKANAYLVKPAEVAKWPIYFKNLRHLWSNSIIFPKSNR